MALAAKYFVFSPNGVFIDWSWALTEFSVLGKEIGIGGAAGVDSLFVGSATSADATGLFSSGGNDALYLTGNFADYQQSVDAFGTYILTRTVGLLQGQTEVIKFSSGSDDDVVYFADGHVVVGSASVQPDGRSALQDDETGAFRQIAAADLMAGGTPADIVASLPTQGTQPTKIFVFDPVGLDVPQLPSDGQMADVKGAGGADSYYVKAGTNVIATGLMASGGNDALYLTGNFADYQQSVDAFGTYTLTRTVGLLQGQTEVIKFSSGSDDDVVYFADGHVVVGSASAQPDGRSALQDDETGEFRQIAAADLMAGGTPGLSDIQSVAIDTVNTTSGAALSNDTLNTGDTLVISVVMKKAVDVTGTPKLAIKVGADTVYADYDSALSGGTTNLTTLKFTYTVPAGTTTPLDDTNGISIDANAITLTDGGASGTINLTGTGTAAKITHALLADNSGFKVDNVAPTGINITEVADAQNADYAAGFSVTEGDSVTVTVGSTALTSQQLADQFTSATLNGVTTYTANPGAFDGSETIKVDASRTDSAGNVGNATQLTLKPIDNLAPTGGSGMSFTSVSSSAQDTVADATTNQTTGSLVFTYNGNDLGQGETFQYRIGSGNWESTNLSVINKVITITGVDLSTSPTVEVRAIDAAGNASATALASQAISYDGQAPAVTTATNPAQVTLIKANSTLSVELHFDQPAILANGKQATIQLLIDRADGQGAQLVTATATGSGSASDRLTFTTAVLPSTLLDNNGIQIQQNSLSFNATEFRDAAGNDVSKTFSAIDLTNLRVESVAPVFAVNQNTLNINSANLTDGSSGTVLFTALATDATDATLQYSIKSGNDAGNFTIDPSSGAVRFASGKLANGSYSNLVLEATDAAGNTATQVLNLTITDSPTVTITHAQAGTAGGGGDVTFTFKWSSSVSDFTEADVSVVGGSIKTALAGSGDTYTLVVTPNANTALGTLVVTVAQAAVSVNTQTNALTPYTLPYDSQASMTMSTVTTDNAVNAQERTDGFNITGTAEAGSTASYSLTQIGGSNPITERTGSITATSGNWSLPFAALEAGGVLADANYRLVVTVTDPKGNITSTTRDFSVDTVAGTLSGLVLSNDTAPAATFGGTLAKNSDSITSDASLALPSGVESGGVLQYRWVSGESVSNNDAAWANVVWSNGYTAPTTDGTYTVQVRQLDKAANVSSITSTSFTLDRQAAITIDALQAGGDNFLNATESDNDLVITGTVKDSTGTTRVGTSGTVTLSLNSKTYTGTINPDGTWAATVASADVKALLAKVPYALTARVTDAAGNTASSNSVNITYDNTTTQINSVVTTTTQMAKVDDLLDLVLGFDGLVTLGLGKVATVTAIVDTAAGGTQEIVLTATGTGNAANTLRFVSSTLPTGLSDYNGITLKADSLVFTSGDFKGQTGADVSASFSAITSVLNEKVDTTAPTVTTVAGPVSVTTAGQGESLSVELTFSENVQLTNGHVARVVLLVDVLGGGTQEVTASVTGTGALSNKLTFTSANLPLGTLSDTDGVRVKAGSLSFAPGTLADQAGNAPTVASLTETVLSNYTVDTQTAKVNGGVNPGTVQKVGANQTIDIDLQFDKNVVLADGQTATITLLVDNSTGGQSEITATATGTGSASKTLTFTSAAISATNLLDTNGIEVKAGSLSYGKLPGTTTDVLLDATGAAVNGNIASNITQINEQVDSAVRSITINPLSLSSGMNAVQATGTAIGLDGETINLTVGGVNTTAVVQTGGAWTANAVDLSSTVITPSNAALSSANLMTLSTSGITTNTQGKQLVGLVDGAVAAVGAVPNSELYGFNGFGGSLNLVSNSQQVYQGGEVRITPRYSSNQTAGNTAQATDATALGGAVVQFYLGGVLQQQVRIVATTALSGATETVNGITQSLSLTQGYQPLAGSTSLFYVGNSTGSVNSYLTIAPLSTTVYDKVTLLMPAASATGTWANIYNGHLSTTGLAGNTSTYQLMEIGVVPSAVAAVPFTVTATTTFNNVIVNATPVTAQYEAIPPSAAFAPIQAGDGVLGSTQERDAALTVTGASTGLTEGQTFQVQAAGTGVDAGKNTATATVGSGGAWSATFAAGAFTGVADGNNVTFSATPQDRAGNSASPITTSVAVKASSAYVTIDPVTLYANSDFSQLRLTGTVSNGTWVPGDTFDVAFQGKTFTATVGAFVNGVATWSTPVLSSQLSVVDFKSPTLVDYATASTMSTSANWTWGSYSPSVVTNGLSGANIEFDGAPATVAAPKFIQFTAPNLVAGGSFTYYNRPDAVQSWINGATVQFILVNASGTETILETKTIAATDSAASNVITITPTNNNVAYNRVKLLFPTNGPHIFFREIDWQAYPWMDGGTVNISATSNGASASAVASINLRSTGPAVVFDAVQSLDNKLDASEKTQALTVTGTSTGLSVGTTFEVQATGAGVDAGKNTATATVGQGGSWSASFAAGAFSNMTEGSSISFVVNKAANGASTLALANPSTRTLELLGASEPYISIDPMVVNTQTDFSQFAITGKAGGGFIVGDTLTVTVNGINYTATVGSVTNGVASWSAPVTGFNKGFLKATTLTDYATASTIATNPGYHAAGKASITDGLTGAVLEYANQIFTTDGSRFVQFTAPNLVAGGSFIYYNRTDFWQEKINGAVVQFILVDASGTETILESKTIVSAASAAYAVITISPTNSNVAYNRVKLVFPNSTDIQTYREIDWQAYEVLNEGTLAVSASATKGAANLIAAGKIDVDTMAPTVTMTPLTNDNIVTTSEASAATLSGTATVEDGQQIQLSISKVNGTGTVTKNVTVNQGAWSTSLDFLGDSALANLGFDRGSQVRIVASVADKAGNVVTLQPVYAIYGDNVPLATINALPVGSLVTPDEVSSVALAGTVTHFNSTTQSIQVVFTPTTGQAQSFNAVVTTGSNGTATWSLNLTADQVKALPQLQAMTVSAQVTEGALKFASINAQTVTFAAVEPVLSLSSINSGDAYGASTDLSTLANLAVSGTVTGLPSSLPNGNTAKVSLQLVSASSGAAIGSAQLIDVSSNSFNGSMNLQALMTTPGNVATWAAITGVTSTVSAGLSDNNSSTVNALNNNAGGMLRYSFGNTVLNGGSVSYVTDATGKSALIGSTVNFTYGNKVVKTITVAEGDFSANTATFSADNGQLFDEVYFVLASTGQRAAEVQINPTNLAALDAKVQAKTIITFTDSSNATTTVTGANVASTSLAVDKAAPLVWLDAQQAGNNIIDATEKSQAVAFTGSAAGGDGGTVTVTVTGTGFNESYQAQVVDGRWSANIPQNVATALADGTYSLSASLTDANGNTSVAPATGSVTVKALAPAITITSMDGTVQADELVNAAEKSNVVFKGTMQNTGDTPVLTIKVAGQILNANTVSFNTVAGTWQTTQDLNTLAPVGTDVASRWTASGSTNLGSNLTLTNLTDNNDSTTLALASGSLKFINLSSGGLVSYSGGTVQVKATAGTTSGATVEFFEQGSLVKSVALTLDSGTTTAGTWSASVDTSVRYDQVRLRLPNATQTLSGVSLTPTALAAVRVEAQVSDGSLLSQTATAEVTVDEVAPEVTLNNLTADNYVNDTEAGQSQLLSGTATGVTDGAVVSVYKYAQGANASTGVLVGTAQVSNGTWQLTVSSDDLMAWSNGSYTLQANVSDAAGNQGQGTLNVQRGVDIGISVDDMGTNGTVMSSIAALTAYTVSGTLTGGFSSTDEVWVTVGSLPAQKATVDSNAGTWTLNTNLSGFALDSSALANTALSSKSLMSLSETNVTLSGLYSKPLTGLVDGTLGTGVGNTAEAVGINSPNSTVSLTANDGRMFMGGAIKIGTVLGTGDWPQWSQQGLAGTKVQFLRQGQVVDEQTITLTGGFGYSPHAHSATATYTVPSGFLTVTTQAGTLYDEVKLVFASALTNEFNNYTSFNGAWGITELQVVPTSQYAITDLAITAELKTSTGDSLVTSNTANVNIYEKGEVGITNDLAGSAYLIQSEVTSAFALQGYSFGVADGATVTVTEPSLTGKTYLGIVQSGQWTALIPKADLPSTGSLNFTAKVTGLDNFETSGSLTATVLASRPMVSLNAISTDGVVSATEASALTVRGSSSGLDTGSTVTLKLGKETLGTTTTLSDGSWSKALDVSAYTQLGKNLLTAAGVNGKALYTVTADAGLGGTAGLYDGAIPSAASVSVGQSVISGAQGKTLTFALAHDYAGGAVKLFNGLTPATALAQGAVIKFLYNGTEVGSYTTTVNDNSLSEINTSVASSVVFNTVSITFNQSDAVLRELQIVPTALAIRAEAALGNLSANPSINSYTLDNVAPTLTVAPVTGDNVISNSEAGGTVSISGTTTGAEAGQMVTVTDSFGNVVATGTVSSVNANTGLGNWTADLSSSYVSGLSAGASSTLKVNAMDAAGNLAPEQSLTLWRVASAPTFSMSTGDNVLHANEWVSGTALASGSSSVQSHVNAVSLTLTNSSGYSTSRTASTDSSGNWSYNLSSTDLNQLRNLLANTNVLGKAVVSSSMDSATAVWGHAARMVDGNTSNSINSSGNNQWVMFTLDQAYQGGALVLNLTSATDSRLIGAKVEFLRGGQVLETNMVTTGGANNLITVNAASSTMYDQVRFTFPGTSAEGQYAVSEMKLLPNSVVETTMTVKAVLTDANGVSVSVPDATVTVDADTPVLSFSSTPMTGDGVITDTEMAAGFAITGSAMGAQAGEVVTVKLGNTVLGTATIAADGRSWALAASQTNGTGDGMTVAGKAALTAASGLQTLTATVLDHNGATSSVASVTALRTSDAAAPAVRITSLNDGVLSANDLDGNGNYVISGQADNLNGQTVSVSYAGKTYTSSAVSGNTNGTWSVTIPKADVNPVIGNLLLNMGFAGTVSPSADKGWANGSWDMFVSMNGYFGSNPLVDGVIGFDPNATAGWTTTTGGAGTWRVLLDLDGAHEYQGGTLRIYNGLGGSGTYINGSLVTFVRDGQFVKQQTISQAGDVIDISAEGLVYDSVFINFSNPTQSLREVQLLDAQLGEVHGVTNAKGEVNNAALSTITATVTSSGVPVVTSVTNIGLDLSAANLSSGSVSGGKVNLSFDEVLNPVTFSDTSGWSVMVNGVNRTVSGITAASGDNHGLSLTLASTTLGSTDVVQLSYTGSNIKDAEGNKLAAIGSTFIGSDAADTLTALATGSTLIGGKGNDTLIGGAGLDRFVFSSLMDGNDTIRNFTVKNDAWDPYTTMSPDVLDLRGLLKEAGLTRSLDLGLYLQVVQSTTDSTLVQIKIDQHGLAGFANPEMVIDLYNTSAITTQTKFYEGVWNAMVVL